MKRSTSQNRSQVTFEQMECRQMMSASLKPVPSMADRHPEFTFRPTSVVVDLGKFNVSELNKVMKNLEKDLSKIGLKSVDLGRGDLLLDLMNTDFGKGFESFQGLIGGIDRSRMTDLAGSIGHGQVRPGYNSVFAGSSPTGSRATVSLSDLRGGRDAQLMDGASKPDTEGEAKSFFSDVVSVLSAAAELAGKAVSPVIGVVGAVVDTVSAADDLANSKAKAEGEKAADGAKFVAATTVGIITIGEGVGVATGMIVTAPVSGAIGTGMLLVAGAQGYLEAAKYLSKMPGTATAGPNVGKGQIQPDPNSMGGDGTAVIYFPVFQHGVKKPGVSDPAEKPVTSGGTIAGTGLGIGQFVLEIKGQQPVNTPGSVKPGLINPTQEGNAPVHNSNPPTTGGMSFFVGQPPSGGRA